MNSTQLHHSQYTPPLRFSTPESYTTKQRCNLNTCPQCGGLKGRQANQCRGCQIANGRPPIDECFYIVQGERCRRIPLSGWEYTLVDAEEYEFLSQWAWNLLDPLTRTKYAQTKGKINGIRQTIHMARMILDVTDPSLDVDHINKNGLDNRKSNLRICTPKQNAHNQRLRKDSITGFIGVHRVKSGKYEASIRDNHKRASLGRYSDLIEAAKIRDSAVLWLWGSEFGTFNFPLETPNSLPTMLIDKLTKVFGVISRP
jgi:ribosomal protein L40E